MRSHLSFIFIVAIFTISALSFTTSSYAQESARKEAPEKVFNASHFTLDNGLEIVVIPNYRAPVVTHMVWYRVGAADEPRGSSGIAHFLEHLMFKGSGDLKPGEFSEEIRRLGGNDNAFTSQDYTAFFQSISVDHLKTVMQMEAGRIRHLHPPPEQVLSERDVILEERRQRTDNNPGAKLNEYVSAALFINHPYGTPIIGWYHEMEQLTWDTAKAFYDRWYGPNNAILIVSGDVEPEEVLSLAKEVYGPLERIDVPERVRPKSPRLYPSAMITLEDENVHQVKAQKIYRVPSYHQNPKDSLALQVLVEIFGANQTSHLYQSLVANQKLATSAGMFYRDGALDDTSLWAYITPAEGVSYDHALKAMDDEIRSFIENGPSEDEVQRAIQRLQDQAIFARDSLSGPAMIIGQAMTTGSTLEQIETWPQQIGEIRREDVIRVAKDYLDPDNKDINAPVTGILLPAAPIMQKAKMEGNR